MSDAIVLPAARPDTLQFWRAYGITMRPYLLFVSGITGVAGMSLVPESAPLDTLILGVVFFLAYGFGQALTDCFQTDTDALSSPYRPLVRGAVRIVDVAAVSLVGLTACAAVLIAYDRATLIPAVLTIVGLATYTWFKRRWWGGPWYNAWIVSLLVLLGYQAAAGGLGAQVTFAGPLLPMMGTALLAYANFVLAGYFKDIEADRATGYRTFPVVFGRTRAAWASDVLAALAVLGAAVVVAGADLPGRIAAAPFLAAALGTSWLAQVRLHAVRTDGDAHRAIAPVVHSYILLLSATAAAHRPEWFPGLIAFGAAYLVVLRHRPAAAQI